MEKEQPSKIKIMKTIEGIKDIKQMLQLLIKKNGIRLEFEKEEKQPMQTVSTLQLGMWVTKSQQDCGSIKALEGSTNERIEPTSGEELSVEYKDLKTIEAEVVEEIRVEEDENLQQKMLQLEGDFTIIIKESHSCVVNVIKVEGDNGFFMKPTAMKIGIIWRWIVPTPPLDPPDASSHTTRNGLSTAELQLLKERDGSSLLTKLRNFGMSAKPLDTTPLATTSTSLSKMLRAIESLQGKWNYFAAVAMRSKIQS